MRKLDPILLTILALLATAALAGCTKEQLEKLRGPLASPQRLERASASVDFCTSPPDQLQDNLKFIFVLDKSGSNQDWGQPITPGTDPFGDRRYLPLLDFLDDPNYASNDSIAYSLVNFSTTASIVQAFTTDRAAFRSLVETERNPSGQQPAHPNDGGWTNYLEAFAKVSALITQDVAAAQASQDSTIKASHYVVVFISDGAPVMDTGAQDSNEILGAIESLNTLAAAYSKYVASLQVNTGYYFNDPPGPDKDAVTLMREMAKRGSGQFFEFGEGQIIDYSRFTVPKENIRFFLKDVIVTNASLVWEDDGYHEDSDGDGLSDDREAQIGSSPTLADSDGNGISDSVELALFGKPCHDDKCDPSNATLFPACSTYQTADSAPGKLHYADSDHDGLNDCEEAVLLKSNKDKFSTSGDWLPDGLVFSSGLGFQAGSNQAQLDPDQDGSSNYTEIKLHTPLFTPNDSIPGLVPYRYSVQRTFSPATQDCYHLDVNQIAVGSAADRIRVYLLESASVLEDKRLLRIAEKVVTSSKVELSNRDFH